MDANNENPDNRSQHQETTEKAIEQDLQRRCSSIAPTKAADQEVDRNQHRLEYYIEQENICRGEDSNERGFKNQDQHIKSFNAPTTTLGFVPTANDRSEEHTSELQSRQ